jgi:molecular chaperone DnaK
VDGAKQALRSGDQDAIGKATEELQAAYSEAGRSLYQAAQAAGGGSAGGGEPSGGAGAAPGAEAKKEDVVEADYEIVDEKDK